MEKVILLKTQLAESAQFAKSKRFGHNRLAVILMDNFVEIQLSGLMGNKFLLDEISASKGKKYSQERRAKIFSNYDELLKASIKENIITEDEHKLLSFCHGVRNNLYHKGDEEKLLIRIATIILQQIIVKYQPFWKSAKNVTSWSKKTNDPYNSREKSFSHSWNTENDWKSFLNKHFNCIDKRTKTASALISEYLVQKTKETKGNMRFIKDEFHIFFQQTKDWNFNDFLIHYSFYNVKHEEIERIKENPNKAEINIQINRLFLLYKQNWRYKRKDRLAVLEKSFKQFTKLPVEKAIEKFMTYKEEVKMIHESFKKAARDLDQIIDEAIDRAREEKVD